MVRKVTLTIFLLGGCVWCMALVSRADSAPADSGDSGFKPVSTVHGLMNGQRLLLGQIGEAIENTGMKKRSEQIESFAEVLAELANINTLNSEKEDYRNWAAELRTKSLALAKEAKDNAGDDAMNKSIQSIKDTCTACHDAYQE